MLKLSHYFISNSRHQMYFILFSIFPRIFILKLKLNPRIRQQQNGGLGSCRPLFSHGDTELMTIYRPKYLFENSKNQLRSYITQAIFLPRKNCTKKCGKVYGILSTLAPASPCHSMPELQGTLSIFSSLCPQNEKSGAFS